MCVCVSGFMRMHACVHLNKVRECVCAFARRLFSARRLLASVLLLPRSRQQCHVACHVVRRTPRVCWLRPVGARSARCCLHWERGRSQGRRRGRRQSAKGCIWSNPRANGVAICPCRVTRIKKKSNLTWPGPLLAFASLEGHYHWHHERSRGMGGGVGTPRQGRSCSASVRAVVAPTGLHPPSSQHRRRKCGSRGCASYGGYGAALRRTATLSFNSGRQPAAGRRP